MMKDIVQNSTYRSTVVLVASWEVFFQQQSENDSQANVARSANTRLCGGSGKAAQRKQD